MVGQWHAVEGTLVLVFVLFSDRTYNEGANTGLQEVKGRTCWDVDPLQSVHICTSHWALYDKAKVF